jgi:hypothetical protein
MKKTDERKENEVNSLRMWFDHAAEWLKGRNAYMVLGSLVLIVAAVFVYRYYIGSVTQINSARVTELYLADSVTKLDEIIKNPQDQDTNTQAFAKLQEARLKIYRDGIEKLATLNPDERLAAVKNITTGRQTCKDLINQLKNNSALEQEVWIDCARAEESLLGIPKEKNSADFWGSYDDLVKDYENAASIRPGSEASKRYLATAATLKEKRPELEKFYHRLNDLNFVQELDSSKFPPKFDPSKFDPSMFNPKSHP